MILDSWHVKSSVDRITHLCAPAQGMLDHIVWARIETIKLTAFSFMGLAVSTTKATGAFAAASINLFATLIGRKIIWQTTFSDAKMHLACAAKFAVVILSAPLISFVLRPQLYIEIYETLAKESIVSNRRLAFQGIVNLVGTLAAGRFLYTTLPARHALQAALAPVSGIGVVIVAASIGMSLLYRYRQRSTQTPTPSLPLKEIVTVPIPPPPEPPKQDPVQIPELPPSTPEPTPSSPEKPQPPALPKQDPVQIPELPPSTPELSLPPSSPEKPKQIVPELSLPPSSPEKPQPTEPPKQDPAQIPELPPSPKSDPTPKPINLSGIEGFRQMIAPLIFQMDPNTTEYARALSQIDHSKEWRRDDSYAAFVLQKIEANRYERRCIGYFTDLIQAQKLTLLTASADPEQYASGDSSVVGYVMTATRPTTASFDGQLKALPEKKPLNEIPYIDPFDLITRALTQAVNPAAQIDFLTKGFQASSALCAPPAPAPVVAPPALVPPPPAARIVDKAIVMRVGESDDKGWGLRSRLMGDALSDFPNYSNGQLVVAGQSYRPITGAVRDFSKQPVASCGSTLAREVVLLDPANSPELDAAYMILAQRLKDKSQGQPLAEEVVLKIVSDFVRELFPAHDGLEQFLETMRRSQPDGVVVLQIQGTPVPFIPIDLFKRKGLGVCRHKGLALAFFLDKLKHEPQPFLTGAIQHMRSNVPGGAHVWISYITKDRQYHVDPQWNVLVEFSSQKNQDFLRNECGYGDEAIALQVDRAKAIREK